MNLAYLTSKEIATIDKPNTFVVVPLGSVEQHGPHLPLGTKSFIAETIAYMAVEKRRIQLFDNTDCTFYAMSK